MTNDSESNDPMADVSGAVRVPHEVLKANAYLRSYVERMQEEADGYRRWTAINSFDPRLWPPSRPQPDETILMEDDLGLIAMARARYEELSDQEKMLDLSHLWASEGDLRPAGVALAAAGRGADDRLVHVATGEMVVPRALLANDPWLRSFIARVFKAAGLDWRTHVVGGPNRINPATGLPEFDPFDTHDDFGGRIESGDVDERTGFDVDHRDPTAGNSSGGLDGGGGIDVNGNYGGGSDSALGGGVGLVASGPGPVGFDDVSAYQAGLPEPSAGIGGLDDHFGGLGGSTEITSGSSVDMAGMGSVDALGGLRRSGASPADRGINLGAGYVGGDPIDVNPSSGYRAPETAFSESSYSKLFDSQDPYDRQIAANDLQESWTKMMDQVLDMPQAEDIAADSFGIVPGDPDWELYGFEYDPVPKVKGVQESVRRDAGVFEEMRRRSGRLRGELQLHTPEDIVLEQIFAEQEINAQIRHIEEMKMAEKAATVSFRKEAAENEESIEGVKEQLAKSKAGLGNNPMNTMVSVDLPSSSEPYVPEAFVGFPDNDLATKKVVGRLMNPKVAKNVRDSAAFHGLSVDFMNNWDAYIEANKVIFNRTQAERHLEKLRDSEEQLREELARREQLRTGGEQK